MLQRKVTFVKRVVAYGLPILVGSGYFIWTRVRRSHKSRMSTVKPMVITGFDCPPYRLIKLLHPTEERKDETENIHRSLPKGDLDRRRRHPSDDSW